MKISPQFSRFILPLSLLISLSELRAQVGNDNPTGPTGTFNGQVTTGCSYDAYTGNATRTITDMVLPGAVGKYGLSYSRTWNTRNPGWHNSFEWSIDPVTVQNQSVPYAVRFPDGRTETFTLQSGSYRALALGVRERLTPSNGTYCYVLLPDGGKVQFAVTRVDYGNSHDYSFKALQIIDPYGQNTSFSYNADGTLSRITESAQRYIQISYETIAGVQFIEHLSGTDGRTVMYHYQTLYFNYVAYVVLSSVTYSEDSSLTSNYTYALGNVNSAGYVLSTCSDPRYAGPMKNIFYVYATVNADNSTPVYGQILSENSTANQAVSTLAITGTNTRKETRGDGRQRTFTYANGYLTGWTDFKNVPSSQTYDSAKYVSSVTDGNGHATSFTNNPLAGALTQIKYPLTPPETLQATVNYAYDDPNNPYHLHTFTDEAGNVTTFTRDSFKQVTRVDYPDGGLETFTYNPFGQVLTHLMKTGGTETFNYTGSVLQEYRNPDNATGNPTTRYQYDTVGRVSGITDVFGTTLGDPNHTTNYLYNRRDQVMSITLPTDPIDSTRHTILNGYNPNGDGTLLSTRDQLTHTTTYTYDDYRRLRSVTTPKRSTGDPAAPVTYFSYAANHTASDDYTHTDANVTVVTLPSINIIETFYDENYRKWEVINDYYGDPTATSYGYDNVGNVISIKIPDEQSCCNNRDKSTTFAYDERNRLMSTTDPLIHQTTVTYDTGGHRYKVTQPNGQIITYDIYDPMNRLLQQTVKQTPEPDAVTKYTYYPSGLLHMMQDPHLINTAYNYSYIYDQMGRETSLTYPPDSGNAVRSESFAYDTAGRLFTYTTRAGAGAGQVQTFTYDTLYRRTGFSWNDSGVTPNVAYGYDVANRLTSITNVNAAISRTYFNDNLLNTETEAPTGGSANTVTYAYLADGNRGSILYPSGKQYAYTYTGHDQLFQVQDKTTLVYQAKYTYDVNGNMATRNVGNNLSLVTDASQRDALGRCTRLEHWLATDRTFDYLYDAMSNRTSARRDGGTTDTYGYDQAQQLTSSVLSGISMTLGYDANGNRTSVNGGGGYTINNLNQYGNFNSLGVTYDTNGNLTAYNGWTYVYDAQNRLTTVKQGVGTVATYSYDGLNRQVIKQTQATTIHQTLNWGSSTFNVWDGWNLIEERGSGNTLQNAYLYGAGEILENVTTTAGRFYYQDGSGSTSHLSDAAGNLLESYTYSGFGQPVFYNAAGTQINGSAYGVRHLFQGQLWAQESGLNDHRNRMALPSMGVFLQPDPIGFAGDPSNLYRYCGNNAVNWSDPSGMDAGGVLKKPLEPNTPSGFFYGGQPGYEGGSDSDPSNYGYDPNTGSGDQVTAGWPGGTGAFGDAWDNGFDRMAGHGDYSPGDHGSSGSGRDGGGGPYSGHFTINWWPKSLTLPYTPPPTPEQAAWTDKGFVPTLVAATVIFAPLTVSEAVLPPLYSAANAVLANPQNIAWAGLALQQFISPSGPTFTQPAMTGWAVHQGIVSFLYPDFGP